MRSFVSCQKALYRCQLSVKISVAICQLSVNPIQTLHCSLCLLGSCSSVRRVLVCTSCIIILHNKSVNETMRVISSTVLYSAANDPRPQTIPKLDGKWSRMWTANDPARKGGMASSLVSCFFFFYFLFHFYVLFFQSSIEVLIRYT